LPNMLSLREPRLSPSSAPAKQPTIPTNKATNRRL
jgi:hypothetical protein